MTINLKSSQKDDPDFVRAVNGLITHTIDYAKPDEVYVIQISNWFDHKWLNFSGKGIVYFNKHGLSGTIDAALDEFSQDKITFPPFNPSRVIEQRFFLRSEDDDYVELEIRKPVHRVERRHSSENLHRRVTDFSDSGVFIWYSSNTMTNQRGSLMTYSVANKIITTWFASFRNDGEWKIDLTKGVDRDEIQNIVNQKFQ